MKFERLQRPAAHLVKMLTMKVMNLGRLSAPRFRTSSDTKLMAAVRGLYMSSMMSAPQKEETKLGGHFNGPI